MTSRKIELELYNSQSDYGFIFDQQNLIYLLKDTAELVFKKEKRIIKMLEENHLKTQTEVTIVNASKIKKINAETRKINEVTDVLSFPNFDFSAFEENLEISFEVYDFLDPLAEQPVISLGEILICPQIVKQQAQELEHSFMREFSFLYVHGLLHLLGYDHKQKSEAEKMFSLQREIVPELELFIKKYNFEV